MPTPARDAGADPAAELGAHVVLLQSEELPGQAAFELRVAVVNGGGTGVRTAGAAP